MNTLWKSRLIVVLAALLWSLSGFFITLLTQPPGWLGELKPVAAEQIACWRCLFGSVMLLFMLRPAMIRWHPLMPLMACCFAIMNGLFVAAMALGEVAEASLLQYTAPLWVFLVNVLLLRNVKATRRDWLAIIVATTGIVMIVANRLQPEQMRAASLALGAGISLAGVLLCLGLLNHYASPWLAFINQLTAGLVALPWAMSTPWPVGVQWLILVVFGIVQVALPYWLMSVSLRKLPAHEAALIMLLDPLLAPWWAWLLTNHVPSATTLLGGAVFLFALLLRYVAPTQSLKDQ